MDRRLAAQDILQRLLQNLQHLDKNSKGTASARKGRPNSLHRIGNWGLPGHSGLCVKEL